MYRICAFYTEDTPYEKEIQALRLSCLDNGLELFAKAYKSRGEWVKNAAIKPEFIATCFVLFPRENILYVDADAVIRKKPNFSAFDGDIGVHYKDGKELLSGTIFLRNNRITRKLINMWYDLQKQNETEWDQRVLQKLLEDHAEEIGVRVVNLPPTYTMIFDSMRHLGEPVIEHMQASRRYKQRIA